MTHRGAIFPTRRALADAPTGWWGVAPTGERPPIGGGTRSFSPPIGRPSAGTGHPPFARSCHPRW
jgi:hypothetical protein